MNYTYSEFPLLSPGGWLWKWHSDIWLDNPLLWGAALRSVGFSSIPGLFPLSAGNPPAPSGDNQHVHRHCHVSLGAQNPSWLRTLKADLLTIVSHGLTTGRLPPDWTLFLWILESCLFIPMAIASVPLSWRSCCGPARRSHARMSWDRTRAVFLNPGDLFLMDLPLNELW